MKTGIKKHSEAKSAILREIIFIPRLSDNSPIPSVRELAGHLKMSKSTIMRAISELTREGILAARSTTGLILQDRAKAEHYRERHPIIISILPEQGYFFGDIFNALEACYHQTPNPPAFFHLAVDDANRLWPLHIRACCQYNPRGLIIKSPYHLAEDFFLNGLLELKSHDIPYILLESEFWLPGDARVVFDNQAGIESAVDHLVRLGHTRIVYLDGYGPGHSPIGQLRKKLFENAVQSRGLEWIPDPFGPFTSFADSWKSALNRLILKIGATAVVAYNDCVAKALIVLAEQSGFSIPQDLSVIGYDNVGYHRIPFHFHGMPIHFEDKETHDLTSVAQPPEKCAAVLRRLLEKISTASNPFGNPIVIKPDLHLGDTTGPNNKRRQG